LLKNAANSALRFGSRCFILIIFRHRLHPVSLSVTIFQGVACRFNRLCCKRRQTTVRLPTLYYLQAFNYAFANPAASQKEDRRIRQGFTTKPWRWTGKSGRLFRFCAGSLKVIFLIVSKAAASFSQPLIAAVGPEKRTICI